MLNFKMKEFEHSDTAISKGIDNRIPRHLMDNLLLSFIGIQKIRDLIGCPIKITSGYRCESLNKLVGGKPNSLHTQALAIDFIPISKPITEIYNMIANSDIPFDKLILERNSKGSVWIHCQFTRTPRRLFFELEVE